MLEANFDAIMENHALVIASLYEEKDKILVEIRDSLNLEGRLSDTERRCLHVSLKESISCLSMAVQALSKRVDVLEFRLRPVAWIAASEEVAESAKEELL